MKNIQYFTEEINYNDSICTKFIERISRDDTSELHKKRLRYSLFSNSFEQLCMSFEVGASKEDLNKRYKTCSECLDNYLDAKNIEFIEIDGVSSYVMNTSIFSVAVLLGIEASTLSRLKYKLFNSVSDSFVGCLCELAGVPSKENSGIFESAKSYSKPLHPLLMVDNESEFMALAVEYLKKQYYKSLRNVYWYQTHQGEDQGFFGYLNFEIAMYSKIRGFDDNELKQSEYYPYKNY